MAKNRRSKQECPKGHSMDPNWISCPYCEVEKRANKKSPPPKKAAAGRQATQVGNAPASSRRVTKPMQSEPAAARPSPPETSENRRIMGVLITYTWRPEGELYAVREGKNYIGRGKISSDPSHRDCDVVVPSDTRMSNEHALILCRHGKYEILDQGSSNGTFMDGDMLMTNQSNELGDSAEIKTGDTLWLFFKIGAPSGGGRMARPAVESRPEVEETSDSGEDTYIK